MKKIIRNIGKTCFISYLTIITFLLVISIFLFLGICIWPIIDIIQEGFFNFSTIFLIELTYCYIIFIFSNIFSINSGIKYLSKSNKLDLLKAFNVIPAIFYIWLIHYFTVLLRQNYLNNHLFNNT